MKVKLFLIVLCMIFLTGCWDRRELNELGIVLATGVDKGGQTGKVTVTAEVVRPSALKTEGSSKGSAVELISADGDTIFEAIRNITNKFDRSSFFAQNKVLVIDEKIAKEGLFPFLDFFERSREINRAVWLIIAKGTTASEVLGVNHGITEIQALYLNEMIRKRASSSKGSAVTLLEFIKKVSSNEINPIGGVMEIMEQPNFPAEEKKGSSTKGVDFKGTAIFKKDKLAGYLNSDETKGLNWVLGKIKQGVITFPDPKNKTNLISTEVLKASSRIKSEISDKGNIKFTIEIKEEGNIVEEQNSTDISDVESFEEVEKETEKTIQNEADIAVKKIQKELRSDVLGFGSALSKQHPDEWEKLKDKWEDMFPNVEYTFKVDVKLRRIGFILKPLKPQKEEEGE